MNLIESHYQKEEESPQIKERKFVYSSISHYMYSYKRALKHTLAKMLIILGRTQRLKIITLI
jgi:hypothetical protein